MPEIEAPKCDGNCGDGCHCECSSCKKSRTSFRGLIRNGMIKARKIIKK